MALKAIRTPPPPVPSAFSSTPNGLEALQLLDLIEASFRSDPTSTQYFEPRVVQRVHECLAFRRRQERRGQVTPWLTTGPPPPSV